MKDESGSAIENPACQNQPSDTHARGISIDTSNESFEHWERVLQNHGLGERPAKAEDPQTTSPDIELCPAEIEPEANEVLDINEDGQVLDDNETIRRAVGPDDPFFEGYQIHKPRERIWSEENRLLDEWTFDDKEGQAFFLRRFKQCRSLCEFEKYGSADCLTRHFPELALCKSCKQKQQAGRWARIIQLYFRMGWNERDITTEIYGKDAGDIQTYKVVRAVENIRKARARDLEVASGKPRPVVSSNNL